MTYSEEQIVQAHANGGSAGTIVLAEVLLKKYQGQISPEVAKFLQMVCDKEYAKVGEFFEMPAEDIATNVADIFREKSA